MEPLFSGTEYQAVSTFSCCYLVLMATLVFFDVSSEAFVSVIAFRGRAEANIVWELFAWCVPDLVSDIIRALWWL